MFSYFSGLLLGWSLGANNAGNVFGTAVASKMLRFLTAAILASVFVIIGSILEGDSGIETLKGLTDFNYERALISSLSAAITVTIMTVFGLPVSTSQGVVGAIIGIGLVNNSLNLSGLGKVVACWVGTPVGGFVFCLLLYYPLAKIYNNLGLNLFQSDRLLRIGLVVAGSYGAYALGANNVANVTAVFVGSGQLEPMTAQIFGGIAIAFGVLTYSKPVMETVGKKLVKLDPFSALIVVLALGLTVHMYTLIGVPVSSSQAVIGAVLAIGVIKGVGTVSVKTMYSIVLAWVLTPVVACVISLALHFVTHLKYVP